MICTMRRVFPIATNSSVEASVSDTTDRSCVTESDSCFIVGDKKTCKTSMLFQVALTYAVKGEQVMFICPQPILHRPVTVRGMTPPNPVYSQHIKIVYLSDPKEFIKYLSHLHVSGNIPMAILVDDLQYYVQESSEDVNAECVLAKFCAVLQDVAAFVHRKRGIPCHLWAAMTKSEPSSSKEAYYRYFRNIWTCSKNPSQPSDVDTYVLQLASFTSNSIKPITRIFFHKENEHLVFDQTT